MSPIYATVNALTRASVTNTMTTVGAIFVTILTIETILAFMTDFMNHITSIKTLAFTLARYIFVTFGTKIGVYVTMFIIIIWKAAGTSSLMTNSTKNTFMITISWIFGFKRRAVAINLITSTRFFDSAVTIKFSWHKAFRTGNNFYFTNTTWVMAIMLKEDDATRKSKKITG